MMKVYGGVGWREGTLRMKHWVISKRDTMIPQSGEKHSSKARKITNAWSGPRSGSWDG